jgi:putative flippase GtrA
MRQLVRYLLFSGLAAAANIACGFFLNAVLGFKEGWRYGAAVAMAYLFGMGVNFSLNRTYTFLPSGRSLVVEIRTFTIVSTGGLVLTVGLSELFRSTFLPWISAAISEYGLLAGLPEETAAHILAVGLVTLYSFTAHKIFTFGDSFGRRNRSFTGSVSLVRFSEPGVELPSKPETPSSRI